MQISINENRNKNKQKFEYKILIIDDEPVSTTILRQYLGQQFFVVSAESGLKGIEIAQVELPDLILLDLALPEVDGYSVCKKLRTNEATRDIPIIIITGNCDLQSRVRIFEAGADDLISKPFNSEEILVRVRSKLRRIQERQNATIATQCGNLSIDVAKHEVRVNNSPINLSALEFELLSFLVKNRNKILNRNQILSGVWKGCAVSKRTIDTHILSLRKKMTDFECDIVSVYGVGYGIKDKEILV